MVNSGQFDGMSVTQVADINADGPSSAGLYGFIEFNGALYFTAYDPHNGYELRTQAVDNNEMLITADQLKAQVGGERIEVVVTQDASLDEAAATLSEAAGREVAADAGVRLVGAFYLVAALMTLGPLVVGVDFAGEVIEVGPAGGPLANAWVRISQGARSALVKTGIDGDYLLYDGQLCTSLDGIEACSGSTSSWTFNAGSNQSTTVAVLGDGAAAAPAPTNPVTFGVFFTTCHAWSDMCISTRM